MRRAAVVLGALGVLVVRAVAVPATKASALGSAFDVEVRQLALELHHAGVRDHRVGEVEHPERRQPGEMDKADVRDLRVSEVERLELWQPSEMDEAGVRNLCVVEVEQLELRQAGEMDEAGVRDLCVVEVEPLKCRQSSDMGEAGVRDLRVFEEEPFELRQSGEQGHVGISGSGVKPDHDGPVEEPLVGIPPVGEHAHRPERGMSFCVHAATQEIN